MKRVYVFLSVLLMIFTLLGCGSNEIDKKRVSSSAQKGKNEPGTKKDPAIVGYVIEKNKERILVVRSKPKDFSVNGGKKEFYDAVWVSNVSESVEVGQMVKVWFEGAVAESYPAQAEADKVVVVPSKKRGGANLSEAEAIRKALSELNHKEIFLKVIKSVKYNLPSDTWTIGIHELPEKQVFDVKVKDQ